MISTVLGGFLIVLGLVSYGAGLITFIRSQLVKPAEFTAQSITDADLRVIKEVLDKLTALMDSFSKLSMPVQWAVLGLLNIGIGAYLIANRPF